MNAELLMKFAGLLGFVLTLHWVRNRELRERYAIGWMIVATLLLLSGLFPTVIMGLADATRLSYPSAVLFVSLAAVYGFSFFVSVSLSRQYRRNVRLAQHLVLVEQRLRTLEGELASLRPLAGEVSAP